MRQNNSKRKLKTVTIVSQNIRGLTSATRLQEMFSHILRFSILAACFQETWRSGTETLSNSNCLLFLSGLPEDQQSRRGSQGVGIALSPQGVDAWRAGGCELHNDLGARVIAIHLLMKGNEERCRNTAHLRVFTRQQLSRGGLG